MAERTTVHHHAASEVVESRAGITLVEPLSEVGGRRVPSKSLKMFLFLCRNVSDGGCGALRCGKR